MKSKNMIAAFSLLLFSALNQVALAQTLNDKLNEQVLMVPAGNGVQLETTIFKPAGPGPFPLLIMNHGKSPGNPHFQPRARYPVISKEFVKRGYAVVIPMRTGFAQSGGTYVNAACNMIGNGLSQAEDVRAVLDYVLAQPWADKERIVIAGQSHGGLSTIAFGASNFPGVKGLINFAGGLREKDCQWQSALVDAFGHFGGQTKVPSIWFYGANDAHFNPELAAKMYAAYTAAGAQARLIAYGPFKKDAHSMSSSADGIVIWLPETENFLQSIGMPTAIRDPAIDSAE